MKALASFVVLLLLTGCSGDSAPPQTAPGESPPGLFVGVDLSKLSEADRQVIVEASEDFQAVVAGRKPVHAVFDDEADLPSDGGTHFYKGNRYDLTVVMTLSSYGGFDCRQYGPILRFDEKFSPGPRAELSNIRAYSEEKFGELLSPEWDDGNRPVP